MDKVKFLKVIRDTNGDVVSVTNVTPSYRSSHAARIEIDPLLELLVMYQTAEKENGNDC